MNTCPIKGYYAGNLSKIQNKNNCIRQAKDNTNKKPDIYLLKSFY